MKMNLVNFKLNVLSATVIFSAWLNAVSQVQTIQVETELTLTSKEKSGLDLLKKTVMQIPAHDWLKSDLALLRWLRAKNLNVNSAEAAFKENISWRKDNDIDSILEEDWRHFQEEYYFDDTGTDFEGRPVIAADISEWDVRGATITRQGDKLVRYMLRGVESAARRVRLAQANGLNVTQWQVILNMDNFSLMQHGCLSCLPIYLRFITSHEAYYPFGADKIIIINTPAAFEVVLTLLRPVIGKAMRDSLMVYGTNRAEWRKFLLSLIPEDQIARHFGGSKAS